MSASIKSTIRVEHIKHMDILEVGQDLSDGYSLASANEVKKDAEKIRAASNIPMPTGYRILVQPVKVKQETESGIYLPDQAVDRENIATVVSFVIKLGPDCYKDATRFPSGPWCKEGDFVVTRSYSGTRLNLKGQELRLINDDTVEAVVEDPRGIIRG